MFTTKFRGQQKTNMIALTMLAAAKGSLMFTRNGLSNLVKR